MKKGCLIPLSLLFLVGLGLIFRYVTTSKFNKREHRLPESWYETDQKAETIKENDTTLMIQNVYGKSLIESGTIEPVDRWRQILIGKWDLLTLESIEGITSKYLLVNKIQVEFNDDNSYRLFVNFRRYETGRRSIPTSEEDASNALGGGMQGKWSLSVNKLIQLSSNECAISVTRGYEYLGKEETICKYLRNLKLGTTRGISWETNVKGFSQDTILITGKDYQANSSMYYYFTRIK